MQGGANPLSVKKRKAPAAAAKPAAGEGRSDGSTDPRGVQASSAAEEKHKRKRQRHKKKGDGPNSGDTGKA
eukprot:1196272-Prorocentrum_minimum.AAC.8